VAVAVPAFIVYSTDVDVRWYGALVGGALIAGGLAMWAWTVRLFARLGKGTLAPWDPTERLVVEGPYRHVRNPMITAVGAIVLGEAALFGSLPLLVWAGAFALLNAVFIPVFEEPGLIERFGDEYVAYRRAVPRWIPRPSPWDRGRY
jgi:protein-S-isoprenylcysteine O-methyltransferase Ste14